jgi:conjugative transfer signal peptidase TraF
MRLKKIAPSNLKILKVIATTTLLLSLIFILIYQLGYRINISESYPRGVYKSIHKTTIEYGDFVMFCPKNSPLMQNALKRGYVLKGICEGGYYPLLKKVAALEGDRVLVSDYVYINGKKQIKSRLHQYDPKGNPLPRTKDNNITVPKGYMFLMSDYHELSFDSRYLGLIEQNSTISLMKPFYIF